MHRLTSLAWATAFAVTAAVGMPATADAGCGCSKPPPPRAAVRPFAGYVDQKITLFSDVFVPGTGYAVQFTSTVDNSTDWSKGRATLRRDFADGQFRAHLRVPVPNVSLGPCTITVWNAAGVALMTVPDNQFTVTSEPVSLHDFSETVVRQGYQAGVGKDGTVYIAVDVSEVDNGTIFVGTANGFPITYEAGNVVMYNNQGFLMQMLDPRNPGLFQITRGAGATSDTLAYWRHEFRTYKQDHRWADAHRTDDDPDWHADGTPHIDHNKILVAIAGTMPNGNPPTPGATPPFELTITSLPSENGLPANASPAGLGQ